MKKQNISKKILFWYDNNKRSLPWRKITSQKNKNYYTLVSEFMLQQTQVNTVIPYFENFIKDIPNLKRLSSISDHKLMKRWEGLGYYSRARNLKKTAKKILSNFNGNLPSTKDDLKSLPGIGEYTSSAIMAIAFNKPIIPLDGNVERVLKRVLYLKTKYEISKENLFKQKSFFGTSKRSSDYAQALMEIGALICKPISPLCYKCPLKKNCRSLKKNDFNIKSKKKSNKIKYFEAKIYNNKNKYLLIKNDKFNFLKNLLIFPMNEVKKEKFQSFVGQRLNIKMSNMDMKIFINKKNKINKIKNGFILDKNNIHNKILPSFTKKIFNTISKH